MNTNKLWRACHNLLLNGAEGLTSSVGVHPGHRFGKIQGLLIHDDQRQHKVCSPMWTTDDSWEGAGKQCLYLQAILYQDHPDHINDHLQIILLRCHFISKERGLTYACLVWQAQPFISQPVSPQ